MRPSDKIIKLLFSAILATSFMTSCTHGDKFEVPSEIPEIKLINISATQVRAHQEEIVFEIEYTDGDGDLGSNDDQDRNVFVIDNRIGVEHKFRLKQLAPDGAVIPITGTFDIVLPNTIITDSTAMQTVIFSIYVLDRAGNQSNMIDTPEITVVE